MKKILTILPFTLLLLFIVVIFRNVFYTLHKSERILPAKQKIQKKLPMQITSTAFSHNQNIPNKYTCNGSNTNPPLQFLNIPSNAKSLVLIVDDPDAPGKTWVHWVIYNIDPQIKKIAENSVPQNAQQAMTDFGKPGYGGPCPPSGTHHYHFKLYALDTILDGLHNPDKAAIEHAMNGHIIEQSELVGLYSKQ